MGGDWAHNDFVELFATGGILLVALYVVVLAWMVHSIWRLWRDERQSERARSFALIAFGALCAFVTLSFINGIVFSVPSLLMGALIGLVRGMAQPPGATFADLDAAAGAPAAVVRRGEKRPARAGAAP